MAKPPFRTIKTDRIYQGRIIKLRVDTLELSAGRSVKREVVEPPGAVVIAALDPQGRVVMVRQHRHAAGESLLELPAGTLEPNEEPLHTAIREMQEETGFYPGTITAAGGFFTAPGFCNEYIHLFIARDLRPQRLGGDDDEDIEGVPVALADIPGLVLSGQIKDAKSVSGLYVLHLRGNR